MREILFRGKRLDNGEWICGGYQFEHGFGSPSHYIVEYSTFGAFTVNNLIKVYSDTVGQFTGLLDKNGNKIFEGDIVKKYIHIYQNKYDSVSYGFIESETYYEGHMFGEIVYSPHKGFCIKPIKYENSEDYEIKYQHKSLTSIVRYRTEIVGNIHDKGELKENKDDI